MNTNECCGCEAEKAKPEYAERSQACKDLSELDTIEGCEAWIKRECPSACVIQRESGSKAHVLYCASVYEALDFNFTNTRETPLLALQNVIGQIKKWRSR